MIDKLNLSSEAPNWAGSSRPRRTTIWLLAKIRWQMSLIWEAPKWLSTPSLSNQRQMVIWPTQKPTVCRQHTSEIIKTVVKTHNPSKSHRFWKYSPRPRHPRYDKSRAWGIRWIHTMTWRIITNKALEHLMTTLRTNSANQGRISIYKSNL